MCLHVFLIEKQQSVTIDQSEFQSSAQGRNEASKQTISIMYFKETTLERADFQAGWSERPRFERAWPILA